MRKKLIVASGNRAKIREIAAMLPEYEIVSYKDMGFSDEIEETGNTFYENALIKAKTVSERLNSDALADDSGLCVSALGGAPGVFSARYGGSTDDEFHNDFLLENLRDVTDRSAKYVCCMVFYRTDGTVISAQGETCGKILTERQGNNGFGYDPLFFSDDLGQCLGLAAPQDKNKISHRFRALMALKEKLNG